MPHREPLLLLLARHLMAWPDDAERVATVCELLHGTPRCFERDSYPGHVTASAWILGADRERSLLTHHKKLGRWLQLGGHADGAPQVLEVALREAREESGLTHLTAWTQDGEPLSLDVDVHWIPARQSEPGHWHHDVRFLLLAGPGQEIVRSEESNDLQWFTDAEVRRLVDEESVLRLLLRARSVLG